MANVINHQILVDGPRNVVIKYTGVLDTSNIAATGQIGASGFTTTTGSPIITFVAGALTPTEGQYITFSDGTTTFITGTYIVSVDSATQITVSTNALAANAAAAITITGTAGKVVIIDPAVLSTLEGTSAGNTPTRIIIDRIIYDVESTLQVALYWDATTPKLIAALSASATEMEFAKFGGLSNDAGAGITGKVTLSTTGWATTKTFTVILECRKK